MAADFPTIKSGAVATYGQTSRTTEFSTTVLSCVDGSDFRWLTRDWLARFTLDFRKIRGYDVSKIKAHFDSAKGDFDNTWGLTYDGTRYANCCYANGLWTFEEVEDDHWNGRLEVVQTT
ncbi:MAG TPA: hypothetical protein VNH18_15150 [Bryobacteraceae bacterium]|nr:hypothetical protein [Bryobacteraceae bacterium]